MRVQPDMCPGELAHPDHLIPIEKIPLSSYNNSKVDKIPDKLMENVMAGEHYVIRMRKGHSSKLRFWFAPVSDTIMNADADWEEEAELSCNYVHTRRLVFPIIRKFYPGEFLWHNELNLMPFEDALKLSKQLRKIARLLRKNYDDPRLASYKKLFRIELLVSSEEYEEKYEGKPDYICEAGIRENIDVVTEFYLKLAAWIETTINEYEPLGFNAIAISAPH